MKAIKSSKIKSQTGTILIWSVVGMTAIFGIGAYAIDASMWFYRKSELQKTADASALAGAYYFAHDQGLSAANNGAIAVAASNGYTITTSAIVDPVHNTSPFYYSVSVTGHERNIFANVFGRTGNDITAHATAEFADYIDSPIPLIDYGKKGRAVNFSAFGPYALRGYGDRYSPKWLTNVDAAGHVVANPDYDGEGFDFTLTVPPNYTTLNGTSKVQFEIYDPGTTNVAQGSAGGIDEIKTISDGHPGSTNNYTTTEYKLLFTPDDNAPDTVISDVSYGNDTAHGQIWITPPGFTVDTSLSQYQNGRFHLQVISTDGTSENGFDLRAGPPHAQNSADPTISAVDTTATSWHNAYSGASDATDAGKNGTIISAHGKIPMNYNVDGTTDIILGHVPATATGGTFTVDRFDTDVTASDGSMTLSYYYVSDSGVTSSTQLNVASSKLGGNCADKLFTDTLALPAGYPGGTWHAVYHAGAADTSSWVLNASTSDGHINLVGKTQHLW